MIFNPPLRPTGNSRQTRFEQWVYDTIRSLHPKKTNEYELDHTPQGWQLKGFSKGRGGGGITVRRMVVKQIKANWLNCLDWDNTGQHPTDVEYAAMTEEQKRSALVKVAKPWELRQDPFDGKTVDGLSFTYATAAYNWSRRKARPSSGPAEIHIIVRPYYVGEIILAVTNITGLTDQLDNGPLDDGNPPYTELVWEDLNSTSHAWAQTDIADPIDSTL